MRRMKRLNKYILLLLLLSLQSLVVAEGMQKADAVLVVKSEKRLYLISKGERYASLPVTFGADPVGHKQQRGDEKTPEGKYMLDYKNENSKFYKSIHISYPDKMTESLPKKLVWIRAERL